MSKEKKDDIIFTGALFAVYIIISICLLSIYRYQINDDGISYITIAQKYLHADFHNAINGFWGPLLSILLVPFLFFNIDPQLASKILGIILGLFTILGMLNLSNKFQLSETSKKAILIISSIITVSFVFSYITPDLLMTCLLVWYFNILFDNKYYTKKYFGLWAAILGGLAYLARNYALPFFLVHFVLYNVFIYIKKDNTHKRNILTNFITGLLVFSLMSGIWICLISNKYGYFTIGNAGKYNSILVGSHYKGQPMGYMGLMKPVNNTSVSVWEDPSYIIQPDWSPFDSLSDFIWQVEVALKNVVLLNRSLLPLGVVSIILLLYITLLINSYKKNKKELDPNLHHLMLAIAIYCSGYILFSNLEQRYFWIVDLLLLFVGGFLVEYLLKEKLSEFMRKVMKYGVKYVLLVYIIFSLTGLLIFASGGFKEGYAFAHEIEEKYNLHGNIATNGNWHESLYISYYLGLRFYGIPKKESANVQLNEIIHNNIDYYFIWNESNDEHEKLKSFKEITNGGYKSLKIYSVKLGGNK